MTDTGRRLPASVDTGDRRIAIHEWPAKKEPRAVVQILHGLAEHSARYDRFAQAATAEGIAVVAHDHRGHGPDYAPDSLGHFADRNGWFRVIADVETVRTTIRSGYRRLPLVLFGHSMGSYIAQCFCMRFPHPADALILSGSTWPNRSEVRVARAIAWLLARLRGPRSAGKLMNRLSFGKFNDRFRPNRTEFDWLSRDPKEVDAYIDDPLCGAISSNRLWVDLLGGLLEISDPKSIARIPADLPVLITGGELDPVGGRPALETLAAKWRDQGKKNLTLKIYDGGRHEMLNETNRDEVTADLLAWIKTNGVGVK